MATIVKMPKLGLTMTEGVIVKWFKKEGERVEKGEPLLEIQTDKVNLEEESPADGIVRKLLYEEGKTVPILTPIAIIGEADEPLPEIERAAAPTPQEQTDETEDYIKASREESDVEKTEKPDEVSDNPSIGKYGKIKATPAAKRIAREYNVDLYQITGTGPNSRIQAADVERYIQYTQTPKASPVAKKIAQEKGVPLKDIQVESGKRVMKSHVLESLGGSKTAQQEGSVLEEIPLTGMRKIIADKMTESVNKAPHFYLRSEVDMTSLINVREELNKSLEKDGIKLSFNDILVKITAKALEKHRIINSRIKGDKIQMLKPINIGLAVALDNGLIVPVIKNAETKSLAQIARESRELIEKARNNKLTPDDYTGGTFTISNLGMFDIVEFTAIINQPESAILALGKIQDRPVVTPEKEIKIKPIMNITLSCDHRVIDGAEGAKFLKTLKDLMENPLRLLL